MTPCDKYDPWSNHNVNIAECVHYLWDLYYCELTGEVCPWQGYPAEKENRGNE